MLPPRRFERPKLRSAGRPAGARHCRQPASARPAGTVPPPGAQALGPHRCPHYYASAGSALYALEETPAGLSGQPGALVLEEVPDDPALPLPALGSSPARWREVAPDDPPLKVLQQAPRPGRSGRTGASALEIPPAIGAAAGGTVTAMAATGPPEPWWSPLAAALPTMSSLEARHICESLLPLRGFFSFSVVVFA